MRRGSAREVRGDEGVVEVVSVSEIVERVILGFSEDATAHEIKDHVAEIFAVADTPVTKDRHHHWTELLDGIKADAFQELLTGDVRSLGRDLLALTTLLDGEIECIPKEIIGVSSIARVFRDNLVERFGEINFRHR